MDIIHQPEATRFVAQVDGQDIATLSYVPEDNTLDFQSVFVRPDHRGGGVAEAITRAAFEHARAANKRVTPTCPYISGTFLRRHPEYRDLTSDV